jgi:hypothetical protein
MDNRDYTPEMGPPPAPPLFLDASILDDAEDIRAVREDIEFNRIEFELPSGLAKIDLLEECRALCDIENFDIMYDLTMQMLSGKDLVINLKNDDGSKICLDRAHITDKTMDMRSVDAINEWPFLMNWLVEFIGAHLLKKFPTPGARLPRSQASENKRREEEREKPSRTP